ncbi:MAG TPA: hypothetical protein PLE48_15180 [Thiobacillus sp.]|jgi:hypothetical protein|uniref:hypothetical protein n=1 Tax=Polaromonas sp. 17-63-33 TaxID=1970413 RepID=UPI000BC967B1|nr:hypothetical protein [Polaromonas sp. 17-63-33]OZA45626.1 MAG: hypothetical protein B7X88_24370 [Polaromonas sp. 17-63-33]HQT32217.1 hypothetical protein [Thiobacillus sp.]HQT71746.1 hypothetical protein [Thiobacillus sp.]
MFEQLTNFVKPILLAIVVATPLLGCSKADGPTAKFTPVGEEREIEGMATEAKLTACGPVSGKAGTCEGTLVVQPQKPGATAIAVEVTRDVTLRKDGQTVFLPQLRGSPVIVKYRATKEGPNVATSIVGQ